MPTAADHDKAQMPDAPSTPAEEALPEQRPTRQLSSARGLKAKVARWKERVDTLRRWVETTFVWRIWERLLENEFVDRSVALGAKGFVSFFPLIIVVGAFVPIKVRQSIVSTLINRFGLSGSSVTVVKQAFASSSDIRRATGVLGLVLLVFYATSFTTALQRVFLKAWRRPAKSQGVDRLRGPAWLGGIIALAALLGGLRHFLSGGFGTAAFFVISAAAQVAFWWATAWLLLRGQVRWRPLLCSAVLTGLGITLYAASAALWMPHTVASDQQQFGFFGVALALVSWFTGAGAVVLIGASAGAALVDEKGRLGRLARGGDHSVLQAGAAPPLPPPTHHLTLVNALGVHSRDHEDAGSGPP